MIYNNIIKAVFIDRSNRFIAHVEIDGNEETVHVKNTGRCKELLIPGAEVWLSGSDNPARKTAYDLIAVRKSTGQLVFCRQRKRVPALREKVIAMRKRSSNDKFNKA